MAWKLSFCAGVGSLLLLPALFAANTLAAIGVVSVLLYLWAFSRSRRWPYKALLLCACFALGSAYAQWQAQLQLERRLPETLDGFEYVIEGRVHGIVARSEGQQFGALRRKQQFDFHLHALRLLNQAAGSTAASNAPSNVVGLKRLRLSYYGVQRFESGQQWRMVVRLRSPRGWVNPGGFDLAKHALGRRIHAYGYVRESHPVLQLAPADSMSLRLARHRVLQPLIASLQYGPILNALLLGDKSALSDAQRTLFIETGTAHLMAISGLHIATAATAGALLAKSLLWMLPRLLLFVSVPTAVASGAVPAAVFYAALSGFAISTQRALVMLLCAAAAMLLHRRSSPWSVLCTAATGLLLFDPLALLGGGFWLSFFAVAVLLLAAHGANNRPITVQKKPVFLTWIKLLFSAQCALLFGMPLIQLALGLPLAMVAPLANLLAVPIVSFWVIPAGLAGLLASYLHNGMASALLALADKGLLLVMHCLAYLQQTPLANWRIEGELAGVSMLVAMLAAVVLLACRKGPLVPLAALLWMVLFAMPLLNLRGGGQLARGDISLWQFDVGQGTAVLVQTAQGNWLFDTGGTFGFGRDAGSSTLVPALRHMGIAALDAVILSHADSDHTGGAESLGSAIDVGQWYTGGSAVRVLPAGVHAKPCKEGVAWRRDGVAFYFLNNGAGGQSENNASCVLMIRSMSPPVASSLDATNAARLHRSAGSVLLTGDIELDSEVDLLPLGRRALAATVLMAPHHGSKTSSTASFLDVVKPGVALFSNGYRNRYAHPHAAVLARYRARDIQILRSDYHGAIRLDFKAGRWRAPHCARPARRHFWVYRQRPIRCGCQLSKFPPSGCNPQADGGGL
ncbi:MAG: DNA internalization-related competence protein ComEC/Rec2 [Pseudomonadales bacterium]|nr:DNA internalization-related competence protein ComEC/Rec2 [Pseudomonadales bacterium]NNM12355.1 DNA internalization-related competence protein ComEC/Rec2 [Pseudomonadales bacterium]